MMLQLVLGWLGSGNEDNGGWFLFLFLFLFYLFIVFSISGNKVLWETIGGVGSMFLF